MPNLSSLTVTQILRPTRALMLATAAAGALISFPAAAQEQAQEQDDQEIVVLGERQGRTIADTATSVTIFDAEDLQNRPEMFRHWHLSRAVAGRAFKRWLVELHFTQNTDSLKKRNKRLHLFFSQLSSCP